MALEALLGTWKLISHKLVTSDGQERMAMFGADPQGYLVITPDERMMTLITAQDRQVAADEAGQAGLYKSLLAYGGKVRVEGGDRLITAVDVSWHPGWMGSEQVRSFSIAGDVLSLMSPEMPHPTYPGQMARGVLKWQRVSRF